MSTDEVGGAYRAGYEAYYMYGRIDAISAVPYDDRTPLAKREEAHDDDKKSR